MNDFNRKYGFTDDLPACVSLRMLTVEDADLLQRISRQTFSEAFGAGNDPEDLRLFLDTAYSKRQLADELTDPDSAFWLLEQDSQPIGYIMTRIKIPDASGTCLCGGLSVAPDQIVPEQPIPAKTVFELERIYILAAHQGKGYGKLLMGKAVAMAENSGFRKMRLGVWQKNCKAIAFYEREGFRIAGSKTFLVGNDVQQDWVMERDVP
jgi:ribosomal protein S18 acetylase RimI-like enzyme